MQTARSELAPFEIDFLPVGNGAASGDAIALRYWDGAAWRIGIIDGGYEETGETLCAHIRQWYDPNPVIDFVVSTHPDNDHMSGLRVVLEQLPVRELWMHVPFVHAANIQNLFQSRRWTVDGLTAQLQRQYPYVTELFNLAVRRGTTVKLPLQGQRIGPFTVMSPSVEMYEGLLPQFRDTPAPDVDELQKIGHWLQGIGRRFALVVRKIVPESWYFETLREGGITSAENESSVILYGDLGAGGILLTGDAGLRALRTAITHAAGCGIDFSRLWLFQVPHHGSRNNISPSVLNAIVGPPLLENQSRPIRCVVSAGAEDSEHPRQVVLNALWRRGLRPEITRGQVICHQYGTPTRPGWGPVTPAPFGARVEQYE
jgi:beta-lactamase superfamily II metal-dependent hydrolase